MLSNNVVGSLDVSYICACFNKSVNILMANFGALASMILTSVFNQYCSNLYGILLCDLRSKLMEPLHVLWRKAIRRVLHVPARTHNRLLSPISGIPSLDYVCISRMSKFYRSLLTSNNLLVHNLAKRCSLQSLSNMGKNVNYLERNKMYMSYKYANKCLTDVDVVHAEVCKEIINVRDGLYNGPLSGSEYCMLLEQVCTM